MLLWNSFLIGGYSPPALILASQRTAKDVMPVKSIRSIIGLNPTSWTPGTEWLSGLATNPTLPRQMCRELISLAW